METINIALAVYAILCAVAAGMPSTWLATRILRAVLVDVRAVAKAITERSEKAP